MGKLLLDFFPVIVFFAVFKYHDDPTEGIIIATGATVIASIAQVAFTRWRYGKVEKMHLVTLAMVVVLGGLTVALRDETFIKWKPSVVNWAFGLAFLVMHFVGERNLVQRMMGGAVKLPKRIWNNLNLAWVVFFVFMGTLNLYVAYSYDTDTWVNFKLFGMLGLTIVFVIGQSLVLTRFIEDEPDDDSNDSTDSA
jgi:intracellular septation protein